MTCRETETHCVGSHSAHKAINGAFDVVPNELILLKYLQMHLGNLFQGQCIVKNVIHCFIKDIYYFETVIFPCPPICNIPLFVMQCYEYGWQWQGDHLYKHVLIINKIIKIIMHFKQSVKNRFFDKTYFWILILNSSCLSWLYLEIGPAGPVGIGPAE